MLEIIRLAVTANNQNYTHKTSDKSVRIGRSLKCEFNVPSEHLSRQHCLFEMKDNKYFLTDLDSKNGVYINGERIPPQTPVQVSQENEILLANLHEFKINSLEIKTRADLVYEKIAHPETETETETQTLNLELEKVQRTLPDRHILRAKRIKRPKKEEVSESGDNEAIKMLIGFILILGGFFAYQAFGL